jgi:hypothetical protein
MPDSLTFRNSINLKKGGSSFRVQYSSVSSVVSRLQPSSVGCIVAQGVYRSSEGYVIAL